MNKSQAIKKLESLRESFEEFRYMDRMNPYPYAINVKLRGNKCFMDKDDCLNIIERFHPMMHKMLKKEYLSDARIQAEWVWWLEMLRDCEVLWMDTKPNKDAIKKHKKWLGILKTGRVPKDFPAWIKDDPTKTVQRWIDAETYGPVLHDTLIHKNYCGRSGGYMAFEWKKNPVQLCDNLLDDMDYLKFEDWPGVLKEIKELEFILEALTWFEKDKHESIKSLDFHADMKERMEEFFWNQIREEFGDIQIWNLPLDPDEYQEEDGTENFEETFVKLMNSPGVFNGKE